MNFHKVHSTINTYGGLIITRTYSQADCLEINILVVLLKERRAAVDLTFCLLFIVNDVLRTSLQRTERSLCMFKAGVTMVYPSPSSYEKVEFPKVIIRIEHFYHQVFELSIRILTPAYSTNFSQKPNRKFYPPLSSH